MASSTLLFRSMETGLHTLRCGTSDNLVDLVATESGEQKGKIDSGIPKLYSTIEFDGAPDELPSWYCARTKPKHEHIAAANLRKHLNLEVFLPRLKMERPTLRRRLLRTVEPLFPGYVFVHCALGEHMNDIRHTNGISSLVHFGNKIPVVADSIIEELRACFCDDETLTVENEFVPGEEIFVTGGAFAGMYARVLRNFAARQRVQILLDILGRSTPVEVDRIFVAQTKNTLADLVPALSASVFKQQA